MREIQRHPEGGPAGDKWSREPRAGSERHSRLAVIADTGRKSYARGMKIQQEAEQELFGVLTPDEVAQLAHIIGKLDPRQR
jgi:DNA-binding MarR family transcriptional regulator